MAGSSPTIVAASLSDADLKASINKLVDEVERASKRMGDTFTSQVERMRRSLLELGNTKITIGSSVDGGSSQRTRRVREETAEVEKNTRARKENVATLDQQAQAIQRAVAPKSARDSYLAFMQGYKEQARQVEIEISHLEYVMLNRQITRVRAIESQIEQIKNKIKEVEHTPMANRTQYIEALRAQIERLRQVQYEIQNNPNPIAGQYMGRMNALRAEHERIASIMKDEVSTQNQSAATTAQQNNLEKTRTEEIRKQARAIRESEEWKSKGRYTFAGGTTIYNMENDAKNRISLEEQLLRLQASGESTVLRTVQAQDQLTQSANGTTRAYETTEQYLRRIAEYMKTVPNLNQNYEASMRGRSASPVNTREYSELEKVVSRLLGVRVEELNLSLRLDGSYDALSMKLKEMTGAYYKMSQSERNAATGQELADKIQRTQRAIQEIQKQMTRPVSFESIIKFNPKTLDEIAYKMQQLSSYRSGLDINTRKNEIRQVNAEYDRLKKKMDEVMQKNQSMIASNTALGRSWNYMKNRLAFYFTVGASTAFVKNLIDIRSQYELNERALGILINSAERGTQIFNELSQMALVSPYTLIELSSAAKQLVAYDVAAKDVVETTRRLADMASAVGVPMERLTYALGQIKAYGYLNSRDNRMFANAGIPLVRQLSDYYTELEGKLVSTADVYDRIKKKAVDYNDVMQVINRMTDQGGRFFDFQAKMADTLKVRLANLTLAWNNMLNEIGKETQGVLTYGIGALRELFLRWKEIDKLIKDAAIAFGISRLALLARVALTNFSMLGRTMTWNIIIGRRLTKVITQLWGSMKQLATSPVAWITLWISAMASAVTTIDEANKAVLALNKSIHDSSKENFDNIQKFLDQYKKLRDSLYEGRDAGVYDVNKGSVQQTVIPTNEKRDIPIAEAEKAWTAIREQIELTSNSSEYFIGKLLEIDDVNERVREGFKYLDEIRDTYGALQGLSEEAVYVQQDFSKWWNLGLGSDSLVENIKDYTTAIKVANGETGGFAATVERIAYLIADTYRIPSKLLGLGGLRDTIGALFPEAIGDVETSLNRIRQNMTETSESIINALSSKNLNTDQWREAYELMIRKAVAEANLSQEEQLAYRIQMEKNFSAVLKRRFDEDREYIKQQDENLTQEEIENRLKLVDRMENELMQSFGVGRTMTQAFYDYLKQQHRSEIDRMFGYLSDKELDTLDKSVPNWREWAMKNAQEFSKANRISFEELWSMINDTNKMRIFIKTTLGDKDEDSEYDKLTKADNDLADANKRRERLLARRRQIDKEGAKSDEELVNIQKELTDVEKAYNDALERGGVLKEKKGNGGSKKDVLGDALSKEIQLVGEVQKRYNEYRKIGVDANTALSLSADEFSRSLEKNNAALAKFGITGISAGKLATMSMREVRDYYSGLLETATKLGNTKGIEALEKAIANLNVEITKIDYKRITDGLNNELAKLKDEYELAVEVDANPELGDAMFGIFNLDPNQLPSTVDEYAERVVAALNDAFSKLKTGIKLPSINITDDDIEAYREMLSAGQLDQASFDAIEKAFKQIREMRKKDAEDTIKQARELQYKLADVDDKIAIEREKLTNLESKLAIEENEEKKKLLRLQIEDQKKAIAELRAQALALMPEYEKVFGSAAEHSARVARKLQMDLKRVYDSARYDPSKKQYILTGSDGKNVYLDEERYTKEYNKLNKELLKTASVAKKIKEAFTEGQDGEVDFAQGLSYLSDEADKVAEALRTAGTIITDIFGEDGAETAEVFNDLAESMSGLSTASRGVSQIMNGDILGGATNVVKGIWDSISSWFDNSDKRITKKVEKSKRELAKLENAYSRLEWEASRAMGSTEIGAQKAIIANRKLALVEIERQLELEKSRKKKKQDADLIIQLEGQYEEAKRKLIEAEEAIANNLLGDELKSAAEGFVDAWVEAWKAGETTLDAINEKMDEMVLNLIKKAATSKIVETLLAPLYKAVDDYSADEVLSPTEIAALAALSKQLGININEALGAYYGQLESFGAISKSASDSEKELSALQQGIQGITEDTAGAIEAIMNGISQQCYLQSDILTQIRDAVVSFDIDVQTASLNNILLQLQSSYQVQNSIRATLEGWSNPSGQAVRVELI